MPLHQRRRGTILTLAAATTALLMVLAGCGSTRPAGLGNSSGSGATIPTGSGQSSSTGAKAKVKSGGTISFAESSGAAPNFIFPLHAAAYNSVANGAQFDNLMWPSLVATGDNGKDTLDPAESMYSSVKYSDGNKTVTVTLKPWVWSNGDPVTSRDFLFTLNLLKANKADWSHYTPGEFPDNVVSAKADGTHTVVLKLNESWNPTYFTDDELGEITLIPQNAWDKTSLGGKVGNYDETTAGAKAVWNFLQKQGAKTSTFATNPLWKVVDGPFELKSFQTDGNATFVPNPKYSGPDKATITKFTELPFTSDTAEFNVLRSGSTIDVGYLPDNDIGQVSSLEQEGYAVTPLYDVGIDFFIPNVTNPKVGSILKQVYVRQALQELVPQQQIIKHVYGGYAKVGGGPAPQGGPLTSALERSGGPYPYNPAKAEATLKAHGWAVHPNGTDSCVSAGTGPKDCGAGVKPGAQLALQMTYTSGDASFQLQSQIIQSSFDKAGVKLSLKPELFNEILATAEPCKGSASSPECTWQLADYGGHTMNPYPIADDLFPTGAPINRGGYSNPTVDRLISAAEHASNTTKAFEAYENYVAKQAVWIWLPDPASLYVYKKDLTGVAPFNVFETTNPQDWHFTS